jgi:hypothetical protein
MRSPLPSLLCCTVLLINAHGQFGSTRIEDDNSPFVPNSFTGSFRMEMHTYKGSAEDKNSPMNMFYWSTPEMTLHKMESPATKGQDLRILTDHKGKWTYTLMTDNKGRKTALKTRKKKITVKSGAAQAPAISVTDETKTIDGHLCRKVIATSAEGTWTGWVAQGLQSPFEDMARSVQQGDGGMRVPKEADGFPLEYEWVSADGKDRLTCRTHDLVIGKVDEAVFSLEGYSVTEIPSFSR